MNRKTGVVTKYGALDIQVCVPSEWGDDKVKAFADLAYPCGTTNGWQIRREGHRLLAGDPERVKCEHDGEFVHVMLDA